MNRFCLIPSIALVLLASVKYSCGESVASEPGDGAHTESVEASKPKDCLDVVQIDGYQISVDTCETPDLTEWARKEIVPMAREWYPKIVKLLPSAGFQAPQKVTISFSQDMNGVAATSGTRVRCAAKWFRANLKGEAVGAVFHELVHVVQQYGRARRENPNATRAPGWVTEGIADYLRWFRHEPQTHGAEITKLNIGRARYDASYRITANFLNWVVENKDPDLINHLNAAIREGHYRPELWKERTGNTVEELGADWKAAMEKKVGE